VSRKFDFVTDSAAEAASAASSEAAVTGASSGPVTAEIRSKWAGPGALLLKAGREPHSKDS